MKKFTVRQLALSAVIAALYCAFTVPLGFMASQSILQIRPAESLTILPVLLIEAIPGVTVGCLISNIMCGGTVYDIILGTLITLIAAVLTRKIKNPYAAALFPIVLNAVFLPLIWKFTAGDVIYFYSFLSTLLTQAVWIYGLGIPLFYAVKKLRKTN